ncbi:MAG: DUF2286 domain-containing protein [Desulfurococcales archaeon]|nr:DUF2286 domain-containing protein [Desulfurococcales archaeon]
MRRFMEGMPKSIIVRVVNGSIRERIPSDEPPHQAVKDVVISSLAEWDPSRSDLIVTKHSLGEEEIYLVSIKGEWEQGEYVEKELLLVAPYSEEGTINDLLKEIAEYTSKG